MTASGLTGRLEQLAELKGPCIEWQGARDTFGYGSQRGKCYSESRTHRAAWVAFHGPIPEGLEVLHLCDNPPCFNPNHLALGTHAENMQDAARKGRFSKKDRREEYASYLPTPRPGEPRKERLTAAAVVAIRAEYAAGGCTYQSLAEKYGMNSRSIGRLIRGQSWRTVADRLSTEGTK